MTYEEIKKQAAEALNEVLELSNIGKGDIFVVGCSSSEIMGKRIGKGSDINAAEAVFEAIYPVLKEKGIFLAAQCCEHLNRAIITEKEAMTVLDEQVNAVPHTHAGGSFAKTMYNSVAHPVVLEHVKATAGMDIGDTLIGMHLKDVAVPLRIKTKQIGKAHLLCARTRPKFIGGERALYDGVLSGGDIKR